MGDGPVDIKLEETGHGTILIGEKSAKASAAVYLNMRANEESVDDGHEMYLTRAQAEQLRDWLTSMLT